MLQDVHTEFTLFSSVASTKRLYDEDPDRKGSIFGVLCRKRQSLPEHLTL